VNLLLAVAAAGIPSGIKKRKLRELISLAASAFGCEAPDTGRLSFEESLEKFALFTKAEAGRCLRRPPAAEEVRRRLFEHGRRLGAGLRDEFRVRRDGDALQLMRIAYRTIGIRMRTGEGSELIITRCFFSRFYDGPTCRLISALDEGIAAGISGGGALQFIERMTETGARCKADFHFAEDPR